MGRRTFCSGDRATFQYWTGEVVNPGHGCVHEFKVGSDPGYVRKLVWARDKGVCAICGDVAPSIAGHHWQADHVVPVAEGGGLCGLENMRTLCTPCHKRETAALRKRLAETLAKGVVQRDFGPNAKGAALTRIALEYSERVDRALPDAVVVPGPDGPVRLTRKR